MLLICYIQKHFREKKNQSKPGYHTLQKYYLPEEKKCHPFYSAILIKNITISIEALLI